MSINMANLFTRLGKIAGAIRDINGFVGTGPPTPAAVWGSNAAGQSGANIRCLNDILTAVQGQLQTPFPELLAGSAYGVSQPLYQLQTSLPGAVTGALTYLQSLGQGLIIDTVNADTPVPGLTISTAMQNLILQMVSQSATIHANQVGYSVTAGGGNTGNPAIIASLIDANGKTLEYAYGETLTLQTTRDQYDGSTAGNETISVTAPRGQVQPSLNYLWPSGNGYNSGYSGSLTVVDPTQSNGSGGNLLNNSSFKTAFVTNQPPYWITETGVAGTNWQDGTSNAYAGTAHCFQFLGASGTLSGIYQSFANLNTGVVQTGGSTSTLTPATVYLLCARVKLSNSSPATGVLTFSFTDGNDVVLNDNSGNACTISYNLVAVANTNYNAVSGALRTPTIMPSTGVRLRIKLTTDLPSGKSVFIDYLALTQPANQNYGGLYTGGPYLAAFRGSVDTIDYVTNPVVGDRWTVAITNDYGGTWQTFLWQTLNIPQIGIPIPSAVSPSIADSLVS